MQQDKYIQGKFKPKNPKKYIGNVDNICFRSSWERRAFVYMDEHQDILKWASEEIAIPYVSPVDNKIHRYFPDVWLKFRDAQGAIKTLLIEIKPKVQTQEPVQKTKKKSKTYLTEVITWSINQAKWQAAAKFCEERGWQFVIITEHNLPGATNG